MVVAPSSSRRRMVRWVLWSTGVFCALIATVLVLWIWLPRWAPEWVIERSPFVTPVIRAVLVDTEARTDENFSFRHENGFRRRMRDWGPGVIPSLVRGLESP